MVQPNVLRSGKVSIEDIIHQNDPFYCECRAYGRLEEVGREDLAVRCHGYLFLDQLEEEGLARRGFNDWDRVPATEGLPLRGIVKELIADDADGPFTYQMLPRMRRDIQELNRLGIVVWDVRADNYRAGRLIDFSQAHTAPHMELDWNSTVYSREQVMECCVRDLACFDDMVGEWNYEHPDRIFWRRFLPNPDFGQRLRNRSRKFEVFRRQEGARFDAAFYDWEHKEKKGRAKPTIGLEAKRVTPQGRVGKPGRNGAKRGNR